jgi:hypothetical protein
MTGIMAMEINLNSRVRIQEDVLFQELQGEAVLLNLKTGVYLGLNQVGTRIWQLLQEDGTLQRVMDVMLQEYEVAQEKLQTDLLNLVGQMEKQGLLAEITAT